MATDPKQDPKPAEEPKLPESAQIVQTAEFTKQIKDLQFSYSKAEKENQKNSDFMAELQKKIEDLTAKAIPTPPKPEAPKATGFLADMETFWGGAD